jgi:hypothetical protein
MVRHSFGRRTVAGLVAFFAGRWRVRTLVTPADSVIGCCASPALFLRVLLGFMSLQSLFFAKKVCTCPYLK